MWLRFLNHAAGKCSSHNICFSSSRDVFAQLQKMKLACFKQVLPVSWDGEQPGHLISDASSVLTAFFLWFDKFCHFFEMDLAELFISMKCPWLPRNTNSAVVLRGKEFLTCVSSSRPISYKDTEEVHFLFYWSVLTMQTAAVRQEFREGKFLSGVSTPDLEMCYRNVLGEYVK